MTSWPASCSTSIDGSPDDRRAVRIVAFPYHDWRKGDVEGRRWRDAHLIEALASRPEIERILVIDRPVSRAERIIKRADAWVAGTPLAERGDRRASARITKVSEKIDVLDIHVPDLVGPLLRRRGWWFDTFADARVLEHLRWAVASTGGDDPVAFAWTPTVAPAVESLQPRALLFDSLDNWMIHPRLRHQRRRAAAAYAALLPTATAVVASAPASRAVLERWADEVVVIPNGVDPGAFQGEFARPQDLPKRPVVGYAGSLSSRIDVDLVVETAAGLPDASFVFVGPTFESGPIRKMRGIPNIHLLGNRHYAAVPAYVRHFDVAWIPHAVGRGETGGDPIKMYEYWAAGCEVVATPIDGLDAWSDRLHLVGEPAAAIRTIEGLIEGTIAPKHATVPVDRTWDAIARQMLGLLGPRGDR
jgi:teichuronic acid biosynthesis glycosyltransferase TuaH